MRDRARRGPLTSSSISSSRARISVRLLTSLSPLTASVASPTPRLLASTLRTGRAFATPTWTWPLRRLPTWSPTRAWTRMISRWSAASSSMSWRWGRTRLRKPFTRPSSWPSTATVPLAVPSAAPPRRFARSAALTCGSTTSPTTRPPRLSSQPPATSTTTTSSSASRPPWRHPPGITRARPRPGLVDQRPRRPSPTTRRTSRDSATSRRRTSSSVVKACRPLIRWVPR